MSRRREEERRRKISGAGDGWRLTRKWQRENENVRRRRRRGRTVKDE